MELVAREVAELGPTRRAVEALKVPLLAVEAGREYYDFIKETRYDLFRVARCPKTMVVLGPADHKFRSYHDALADLLVSWLERRFSRG